jgi:hypothetical protein
MGRFYYRHEARGSRRAPCGFDRGCRIVDFLFASIRPCDWRNGAKRTFVRHCAAGNRPRGPDCNRRAAALWASGRHSGRNGRRSIPRINSSCDGHDGHSGPRRVANGVRMVFDRGHLRWSLRPKRRPIASLAASAGLNDFLDQGSARSVQGQSRHYDRAPMTSGLPPIN